VGSRKKELIAKLKEKSMESQVSAGKLLKRHLKVKHH